MAVVRSLLAAVVLTAIAVTVGVSVRGEADAEVDPSTAARLGTPLASYDTSGVVVARAAFCSAVGPEPVAAALGDEPDSSTSYGNGERAQVTRKIEDVAHEFDCTWVGADGTVARAWVFAPPVTPERARDLASAAPTARGCEPVEDAPAFGSPSASVTCASGTELQASYRGLFGDAWLACSITTPATGTDRPELLDRAGRWCVAVAKAASGGSA